MCMLKVQSIAHLVENKSLIATMGFISETYIDLDYTLILVVFAS